MLGRLVSLPRCAAFAAALWIGACGSTPQSPEFPNATHRVGTRTELYRGSPQQGRPADTELAVDTHVRVIEINGSYSLVETADGDGGWVQMAALQPLGMR